MKCIILIAATVFAVAVPTLARAQPPPPPADDDDLEVPAAPSAAPSVAPPPPSLVAPPTSTPAAVPVPAPVAGPVPEPASKPAGTANDLTPTAEPARPDVTGYLDTLGLVVSGYVQAQYESSQLSEDQLQQGGNPLNQNRFLVRRGRVRVDRAWEYAAVAVEVDGSTTRGPYFGARRAEASLVYRNKTKGLPPLIMLTAGLTEIPFGFELTDSSRRRVFMERSTASLAYFPGEPDVGARLSGGIGFFRYAVGIMNGEPIDDRPGRLASDPNSAKDVMGRVGVDIKASPKLDVSGGVSFLTGKGFHKGQDAGKNGVVWRDLNENGAVDSGEVSAIPGIAATPSQNFNRWGVGADVQLGYKTPIGWSRFYGEVTVASNMDRSLFVADPVTTGIDVRELGYSLGVVQEITPWGLAGFRFDAYDPNSDFLDKRGGKLIPTNQSIKTLSPVVGFVLPGRGRLLFQYDFIRDALARDTRGVPTDLKNDQLTLRLQVEL